MSAVELIEVCKQPYQGGQLAAGLVEGHPTDTLYLSLFRENDPESSKVILLRPDEMAAIVYVCGGALFSEAMARLVSAE